MRSNWRVSSVRPSWWRDSILRGNKTSCCTYIYRNTRCLPLTNTNNYGLFLFAEMLCTHTHTRMVNPAQRNQPNGHGTADWIMGQGNAVGQDHRLRLDSIGSYSGRRWGWCLFVCLVCVQYLFTSFDWLLLPPRTEAGQPRRRVDLDRRRSSVTRRRSVRHAQPDGPLSSARGSLRARVWLVSSRHSLFVHVNYGLIFFVYLSLFVYLPHTLLPRAPLKSTNWKMSWAKI